MASVRPLERRRYSTVLQIFKILYLRMTVASIPLDRAYLTAIWLETLFYGEFHFAHALLLILIILASLRNKHCSVWLVSLHISVQAQAAHGEQNNYDHGDSHVLVLHNPCLPWLPAPNRGVHNSPRPAWWPGCIFLQRLHSCECCQGLHTYHQRELVYMNMSCYWTDSVIYAVA